jgi:ABC-2 type transport system permease protein
MVEEEPMAGSYAAEIYKFIKRPAVWVVSAVWLALLLAFTELFPYIAYRSATSPQQAGRLLAPLLPAQLPGHVITGYPVWGGALILVLGALCWGSEYGWGTLKTMLSHRSGRLTFYAAQILTLATSVAALVVVAFGLCSVASVLIAISTGLALDLPSASAVAQAMAAGWLILMMWSLLGVCLAIVLRGMALPIGLGLVWILAVENLIRFTAPLIDAIGQVEKFMPGADAGSLVAAMGGAASSSTGVAAVVGGAQALSSVALYTVLFAAVGAVTLKRRDVQ